MPQRPHRMPNHVRLSHDEWERVNEVAFEIQSCSEVSQLVQVATQELPRILSADWACWNETNPKVQVMKIEMTDGYDSAIESYLPEINAHVGTHPVVNGLGLADTKEPMKGVWSLTDFTPSTQLDQVPIWSEAYRHMNAKHQLLSEFCSDGDSRIMLTLNADSPFEGRQRTMLSLLSRHFQAACQRFALGVEFSSADGSRPRLTRREKEVLVYLMDGKTNPEIAVITSTSSRTVEKHVARVLEEFKVDTKLQLLALLLSQRQTREL